MNGVQWEKRQRGWPRNTWQDEALKDTGVLGVKNWTKVLMDRAAWHDLVEKSKTHKEFLFCLFTYLFIYHPFATCTALG